MLHWKNCADAHWRRCAVSGAGIWNHSILRNGNPRPQLLYISPPNSTYHSSPTLSYLAFARVLYQREDDREVSVSGEMRQCVHVTQQCFIHQGVRLMYKVSSLTIARSEDVVKKAHEIRRWIPISAWSPQNEWRLPRGSSLSACRIPPSCPLAAAARLQPACVPLTSCWDRESVWSERCLGWWARFPDVLRVYDTQLDGVVFLDYT